MLRAFVDESYCDDWFFMVAAMAVDDNEVQWLDLSFTRLIDAECKRLNIGTPEEIHGYELFQGQGAWEGVSLQDRLAVAGKVMHTLAEHDIRFVCRGLDRAAQRRRYPTPYEPYPMILTHVMREVNKHAALQGTTATIVCDEYHKHDRHRAMLERHRAQGTPGFTRTTLESVVGQLEFVPSTASAMIQAADVVAYLRHRASTHPRSSRAERRTRARLWRIIEPQILQDYCWVP